MVAEKSHPPVYLLDEIAAGNTHSATFAHIAGCQACQTYVERSKQAAQLYAETQVFDSEADVVRARESLNAADTKAAAARRFRVIAGVSLGVSLAAAMALVLTRTPKDQRDLLPPSETVGASSDPSPDPSGTSALRFKGKLQLALVVERQGVQQRTTQDFALLPNDAVRVELSVDQGQPMVVGFLADDGTWISLIGPAQLARGVHLSENALHFDDKPTPGRIIAGSPHAVTQARASRNFTEVTTLVLSPRPQVP